LSEEPINNSEAGQIIAAIERLSELERITIDDAGVANPVCVAVLPEGKGLVDLAPYIEAQLPAPRRIKASPVLGNIPSLIEYVNRFKFDGATVLFATDDPAKPSLLAVIDFHGGTVPGFDRPPAPEEVRFRDETPGSSAMPRFGEHVARYNFPLSEQVLAWSKISGQPLSHTDMAAFIDERQFDVANPPLDWMQVDRDTVDLILHLMNIHDDQGEVDDAATDDIDRDLATDEDRYIPRSAIYKLRRIRFASSARLIQMARTVEISANSKTVEGYKPHTGERTIEFKEEHDTRDGQGRKIIVPDAFLLQIPLFEGETPVLVPVRLQYRHAKGNIAWFLTLMEWRRVVRYAVKVEAERVKAATELPLFFGARSA
jgi:hypothetical protein